VWTRGEGLEKGGKGRLLEKNFSSESGKGGWGHEKDSQEGCPQRQCKALRNRPAGGAGRNKNATCMRRTRI